MSNYNTNYNTDPYQKKNHYYREINRVFNDIAASESKVSYNVVEIRNDGTEHRRNAKRLVKPDGAMKLFDECVRNPDCQKLRIEFYRGELKSSQLHEMVEIPIFLIRNDELLANRLGSIQMQESTQTKGQTQENANGNTADANYTNFRMPEPQTIFFAPNGQELDIEKIKGDVARDFELKGLKDAKRELEEEVSELEAKIEKMRNNHNRLLSLYDIRGARIEALKDRLYEIQNKAPNKNAKVVEAVGKIGIITGAKFAENKWNMPGLGDAVATIISAFDNAVAPEPTPEPEEKEATGKGFKQNTSFKFDDDEADIPYVEDTDGLAGFDDEDDLDMDEEEYEEELEDELEDDSEDSEDELEDDSEEDSEDLDEN